MGTYLTDGQGRSLYMFASDTSAKSSCTGQCLTYWPRVTGAATASGGANASLLGTISGTGQVTYSGHPLYTYAGDKSAGETNGQGSDNFGAKWWLLAPSGQQITTMSEGSSSSSSSSSSSGSGGGGYGWS
jgi:predicted lipoprotein with Yx(FWY)xxD motif